MIERGRKIKNKFGIDGFKNCAILNYETKSINVDSDIGNDEQIN